MIRIGLDAVEKTNVVRRYIAEHDITKVFVISPERFAPSFASTKITDPNSLDGTMGCYLPWPEHIEYRYYYKIIQLADPKTLLIINECLRGQQRTVLNFNCLRTFTRHVKHQIVFQYLPIVDSIDDVMTLIDLDTRSKWWDRKFDPLMLKELDLQVQSKPLSLIPIPVEVDASTLKAYCKKKQDLLEGVKNDPDKDPHNIPRNLMLLTGRAKLPYLSCDRRYVGRNNRFNVPLLESFRTSNEQGDWVVFELPHNVIDLSDHLTISRQATLEVLVANTKAEQWYLERFQQWVGRVNDASSTLHG